MSRPRPIPPKPSASRAQASPPDFFSPNYFEARRRFLAAAGLVRAWVRSFPIVATGPKGEPLSIDTAYLGAGSPKRLLILSSGTHGVEGYAGSALQLAYLTRYGGAKPLGRHDGVLLVHALNPFGYAHGRRANEHNVDLNRNALERFPGPRNPHYAQLDTWLNPRSAPGPDFFLLRGLGYALRLGPAGLKQAIARGQYEFPKGIFYGGAATTESLRHFAEILGDAAFRSVERVLHLDAHTGLGRFGGYRLLVDFSREARELRRLRRWFGKHAVEGSDPRESVAYRVTGEISEIVARSFPQAERYPIVLEFGTYRLVKVIAALRAENCAHFHGQRGSKRYERAKSAVLEVFNPASAPWRGAIVTRGERVLARAQAGLFDGG